MQGILMGALVALSTVGTAVGPLWRTFQDNNIRLYPTLVSVHASCVLPCCCTCWLCTALLLYMLAMYSLVVVHASYVQPVCCTRWPCAALLLYMLPVYSLVAVYIQCHLCTAWLHYIHASCVQSGCCTSSCGCTLHSGQIRCTLNLQSLERGIINLLIHPPTLL